MIIISRLEFMPKNPAKYPCQIFYKKDGDITSRNKYKFDNKDGDYILLDGYYMFCTIKEEINKVTEIETGKEVYFEDLVKIDPNSVIVKNKEDDDIEDKQSIWNKIITWFKNL